jgi:hypothetical protein
MSERTVAAEGSAGTQADLWRERAADWAEIMEGWVREAHLTPQETGYIGFAEVYPDLATMLCGYMAAPPFVRAARMAGEDAAREALTSVVQSLETPTGGFRLEDEVRYLIATA